MKVGSKCKKHKTIKKKKKKKEIKIIYVVMLYFFISLTHDLWHLPFEVE